MSRSLVLTVDPAHPPISGAELRNWQNARALAGLGPVRLVSFRPSPATGPMPEGIDCASLMRDGEAPGRKMKRRRSSLDLRVGEIQARRLSAEIDVFRPDTVLVEGITLFPLLAFLRPRVPRLILDMHNIESDLGTQTDRRDWRTRLATTLGWSDAARIRSLEREATALVDQVWVCSTEDRRRLQGLFGTRRAVAVVPNGIPRPDEISATLGPPPTRAAGWPVILFVGHLGYSPNVDAVRRLAATVFPLIRKDFPGARLVIAGRSPAPEVAALAASHGFDLVAGPDALAPLHGKAHLSIVPLATAGGTRLKILEALAFGVPVIATRLAAEGLDLSAPDEIVIADDPAAMAAAVKDLCSDPARLENLRRRGHHAVITRFGPQAIVTAVRQALAALPVEPPAGAAIAG